MRSQLELIGGCPPTQYTISSFVIAIIIIIIIIFFVFFQLIFFVLFMHRFDENENVRSNTTRALTVAAVSHYNIIIILVTYNPRSLWVSANNNSRLQTPTDHLYFMHYCYCCYLILYIDIYTALYGKRRPITSSLIENWFCAGSTRAQPQSIYNNIYHIIILFGCKFQMIPIYSVYCTDGTADKNEHRLCY